MKRRIPIVMVALVAIELLFALGCDKKEKKPPVQKSEQKTEKSKVVEQHFKEKDAQVVKHEKKTEPSKEAKDTFIPYKVLRQWTPERGGVGMIILVSEKATKEEVMALASHLRYENLSKGWIWIDIFDSREAYLSREAISHGKDTSYPEEKYFKHWLVNVCVNPSTGNDETHWVADGRDH